MANIYYLATEVINVNFSLSERRPGILFGGENPAGKLGNYLIKKSSNPPKKT